MNKEHLKKYVRDYIEGEHWKYEALYLDKHDYEMILAALEAEPCEDTVSRQQAIDALDDGAEYLRRILDVMDFVGVERAKFEWGLGLIEACIVDIKELPAAQPEPCGDAVSLKRLENSVETSIEKFGNVYSDDLITGLRMCVHIAKELNFLHVQPELERRTDECSADSK